MRISGVKLIADVAGYKRDMRGAAAETDKTKESVDGLGKSSKAAGVSAKGLGDDFHDTARDARALKSEIRDVEGRLHSLAREFAATNDAAARLDIAKAMRKQQGELRQLMQIDKFMPSSGDQQSFGKRLGATISGAAGTAIQVGPLSPALTATLGAAAIAAAPMIGAAVSGAVLGAVGAGGIAGGLALAAKDQRVVDAAKRVAAQVGDQLQDAALPMVSGAIGALDDLQLSAARMDADLRKIFSGSAKNLDPLTQGLTGMVERLVPSLRRAVEGSGPVFDMLSESLPELGDAIGDMLDMISDSGPEAAAGLRLILDLTGFVVRQTGMTISMLTDLFGFAAKWGMLGPLSGKVATDINTLRASSEAAGGAADDAGGDFDKFQKAVEASGAAAKQVGPPFESLYDALRRITGVNISAAEAALDLKDAYTEAAKAIDKKKKVSDKEERALLALATTMNTTTDALDAQGRSTVEATAAHEKNRKKLIATAEAMGYSREEAVKLANQYIATPKNVDTKVNQPGMKKSRDETKKYHGQLDKLSRQITTKFSVNNYGDVYGKLERLLIQQRALATGKPVSAVASAFNKNAGKGFRSGGWTGPGGEYDEAGVVHADEFVIKKESRRKIEQRAPGALDEMNATGRLPGYRVGGLVAPFRVNTAMTKIMSMAEALSKVQAPGPGAGATAPFMVGVLKQAFPGLRIISTYRPGSRTLSGSRSYHGMNRAVDTAPNEAAARFMYGNYKGRLKEAITPYQEWNVHNGRDRRWSGAVWRQHNFAGGNAHNHFAMAGGGVIPEPVMGVGRSGATYSFAEHGPERVLTTAQTMAGAGGGTVNHVKIDAPITIQGSNLSPQQIADQVDRKLGALASQLMRGA